VNNSSINLNSKKFKIAIITLGCSKNTVDSEFIAAELNNAGYTAYHSNNFKNADAVLINTCGFILDAKEESLDVILKCLEAKTQGLLKKVFVMGCLVQRYKNELKNEMPEVDAFFSFNHNNEIVNTISGKMLVEINTRLISTPSHFAYLKISEGCNSHCSFCAIPAIRGKHISKPIEKLVDETEFLVQNGAKEIIVIAQDTTFYGKDIYSTKKLAFLLNKLSDIKGVEWLRLHYAYPSNFPDDVIDTLANNPKLCKYLDIPLQHISDKILKLMNRRADKISTIKLIDKLKTRIPNLAIRTAFITGFPTETKNDFNELKNFVEQYRFERMGVFTYSNEEGTEAFNLKPKVSERIKTERADELMLLQQQISYENNLNLIGKSVKVIIDSKNNDFYIGRTEYDSPEIDNEVLITSDKTLKIGDLITVKVTDAEEFDIYATV